VRTYGASDCLVELEGGVVDEICCHAATIEFGAIGRGVRAVVRYAPGDARVWRIAVEPLDEDVPMYPCAITQGAGHSPLLVVDCPAGTPVRWWSRRR
jgi:hypothetical protein